jgi:hypothetical protein
MGLFSKLFNGSGRNTADAPLKTPENKPEYRGVEIVPHSGGHCAAVDELAGYRILADDAPSLPLPDCDQAVCHCRYEQFHDRRTDFRRDADVGIGGVATMLQIDDVRSDARGRRVADNDDE